MKELWLLRHAKSSWKDASLQDFDRPLKGRGLRNAHTMGRYFQKQGLYPDAIICSPALRTVQTLERIVDVCKWPRHIADFEPRVYESSSSTLREILTELPEDLGRVLLIGHNPGLEMLLQTLIGHCPSFPDDKVMPTAAFAQIRIHGSLMQNHHQLLRLLQVRALDPDSLEIVDADRTFFDLVS
jgi:phosphohistidine phosphatase